MTSAEFKERKRLIMGVDKTVSDFSLQNIEHNLTGTTYEVKN